MQKITQFKSVLSTMDIIVNISIVLIALAGCLLFISQGAFLGITTLVYAINLWLFKVLTFGMSYSVIKIAENTNSKDEKETNQTVKSNESFLEIVHKNKIAEFIDLYFDDERNTNNPVLKRIFDNISKSHLLESTQNIESAIKEMLTK